MNATGWTPCVEKVAPTATAFLGREPRLAKRFLHTSRLKVLGGASPRLQRASSRFIRVRRRRFVSHTIQTTYDDAGQVVGVIETDTTNPAAGARYEYTYDFDGHLLTSGMAPSDQPQTAVSLGSYWSQPVTGSLPLSGYYKVAYTLPAVGTNTVLTVSLTSSTSTPTCTWFRLRATRSLSMTTAAAARTPTSNFR